MKPIQIYTDPRYRNDNLIDILILEEPNRYIRYATYNKKLDRMTFYYLLEFQEHHQAVMSVIDQVIEKLKK